jgi:head-tail adaptor
MSEETLIHPKMLESLHRFFPSRCMIEEATVTVDEYRDEVSAWSARLGHEDIPCAMAAAGGQEVKRPDMTYVPATHRVTLAGHYPEITEKMRAVVDDITLDILLVEHDSHGQTTRLACEVVT